MKNFLTIIIILIFIVFDTSSVFASKYSQSELRGIQTRIIEASDEQRLIKAIANTLQDSDYTVEELESELGFIRAKKIYKKQYINKGRFAGQSMLLAMATSYAVFTWGSTAAYTYTPARKLTDELHSKNAEIDVNVNIDPYGKNKYRVRMIVSEKILQNAEGFSYTKPAPLRASIVCNKDVYEEFFNQLSSNLTDE